MKSLLALAIGPVQDFIAAGRRPADLYAGSSLLQHLVQTIARSFPSGSELIFPAAVEHATANKLLAVVEDDPKHIVEQLKHSATRRLEALWEEQVALLPANLQKSYTHKLARVQIQSFLEMYAAWHPLEGDDYLVVRGKVEKLLAARKALRNFPNLNQDDDGVPKSPLDPAFAAVIDPRNWQNAQLEVGLPLRIKPTETLDAVSLLKRIYGVAKLGHLPSTRLLARRAVNPAVQPQDIEEDSSTPEQQPYFAVLRMDGDRIGQYINSLSTIEEHKTFSKKLAEFARLASSIIRNHGGYPVYAGGDDVLAFLPITKALSCAKALHDSFINTMGTHENGERISISGGIAIVHYRRPLSLSLEAARMAERSAKEERNALAVALHTRGGVPVISRLNWQEFSGPNGWETLIKMFEEGTLPRGLPYELASLAEEWFWGLGGTALKKEAERITRQKVGHVPEGLFSAIDNYRGRENLKNLAQRMMIARFLSVRGGSHA